MKIKNFIDLLKKFPEDSEIKCLGQENNYEFEDNFKDIVSLSQKDDEVYIIPKPRYLEELKYIHDKMDNIEFNNYDSFELYSSKTGDIINYTPSKLSMVYKNLYDEEKEPYDDYELYSDPDFLYVGGLIKFLSVFPKTMKVNIKMGDEYSGDIHEIKKRRICYYTGVNPEDGDVYEDCEDELFLIYGVPVSGWCGGGSFPLTDNTPWNDEVSRVIFEPLVNYFKKQKSEVSDEEKRIWSNIIDEIKDNLYKYYKFSYRLNGSWDSNGYFHPYDKDNLFKKPVFKEDIE